MYVYIYIYICVQSTSGSEVCQLFRGHFSLKSSDDSHPKAMPVVDAPLAFRQEWKWSDQWMGLRENQQETIVSSIMSRGLLDIFLSPNSVASHLHAQLHVNVQERSMTSVRKCTSTLLPPPPPVTSVPRIPRIFTGCPHIRESRRLEAFRLWDLRETGNRWGKPLVDSDSQDKSHNRLFYCMSVCL